MSGAYDMVNRMRQNRALRNSQRHKERRDAYLSNLEPTGEPVSYGNVNPNGMAKVQRAIIRNQEQERQAKRQGYLIAALSVVIILSVFTYLINSPSVIPWINTTFDGWFR